MDVEPDPLGMPAEEMRRAGYATVDALVDLLGQRPAVIQQATPAEMRGRIGGPAPEEGEGFDRVLSSVVSDVLPFRSQIHHPGYFAYIPGSGTWPGALGDFIASAMNLDCGNWMESSGPSQVELEVIDWFRRWIGYPAGAEGLLVSGGSAANLTALACARELRLGPMTDRAVIYCSDQSHSSVPRAARTLGFRPGQLRVLPSDESFRLRLDALTAAVAADREAGLLPLLVSANAGATNTGAVDPLPELAEFCRAHRLWLHVDASYGGFAVLTERGAALMRGLDLADSVALDPHKWLYQPFECAALLVREPHALERAFSVAPDYLADTQPGEAEVNFAARGLQLTRGSRALKLWLSLRTFGLGAFRDAIQRSLDLAAYAEELVRADDRLELMMPATLGIVCFRRRLPGSDYESELAAFNAALIGSLAASGSGMVSSTRLRGRYAIRLCVLNHSSRSSDIRGVLEHLATAEPSGGGGHELDPERILAREPDPVGGAPDELGRHPLVSPLTRGGRLLLASQGAPVEVPAGTAAVRRWAPDRDFYLVLSGSLSVDIDGEVVRELGPGTFFGELAARDWGSGFGYPRLATVTARSDASLWQVPPETFAHLMALEPTWGVTVQEAIASRLPQS